MSQRQKSYAAPLADYIEDCVSPALRRQGFASSDLLVSWAEIVGARLAGRSEPIEIRWPHRPPLSNMEKPADAATLIVRVDGSFALEFEYGAALMIERINAHFGWRCVGRVLIKQGPVKAKVVKSRKPAVLDAVARDRLTDLVADTDPKLAAALTRLGEEVFATSAISLQKTRD